MTEQVTRINKSQHETEKDFVELPTLKECCNNLVKLKSLFVVIAIVI